MKTLLSLLSIAFLLTVGAVTTFAQAPDQSKWTPAQKSAYADGLAGRLSPDREAERQAAAAAFEKHIAAQVAKTQAAQAKVEAERRAVAQYEAKVADEQRVRIERERAEAVRELAEERELRRKLAELDRQIARNLREREAEERARAAADAQARQDYIDRGNAAWAAQQQANREQSAEVVRQQIAEQQRLVEEQRRSLRR